MLDKEASVELKKFDKREDDLKNLVSRFEDDYEYATNRKFEIPEEEGDWESFTTNRGSTDLGVIRKTLLSANVKLKIKLSDENEKERESLSKTEQFPYGIISLRDSLCRTIPEAQPLHSGLSSLTPLRGWTVVLCYLYTDDDKTVKPYIPVWDMLNVRWISGERGLIWIGNKRYTSPEYVKDEYGVELKPDTYGNVIVYDIWDKDQFGVAAPTGKDGGSRQWLKEPKNHNCGHLPAMILPVGSAPFVQSDRHRDSIKDVGESWASNDRLMYDIESRIGSYLLTFTGRTAKAPMAHEYDSTKTGGIYPALDQSPFKKGSEIPIDVGKGEKIVPLTTPEMNTTAFAYWEYLQSRLVAGSKAPFDLSSLGTAGPAAGLNILRHQSLTNIRDFIDNIERAYEWLADEMVSQYKSGDFGKMEVQGIDGSNRRFKFDVKPKDINDKWNFECKLYTTLPQDDMGNVGMAMQVKESGLLSDEEIIDKYNLSDAPELTQQKIDRQKAYAFAFINERRIAAALVKDGNREDAQMIMDEIAERRRLAMEQQQQKGIASQPGMPSPVRPSGTTTAAIPTPPAQTGMRKWLSRVGGA